VKDAKFRSATPLIHVLADTVSKNGNLLLDIGPRPDGTIVEEEQAVLRDIGGWLHTNGAAIYRSRPWRTFGEGPTHFVAGAFQEKTARPYTAADFRFTTHDGRVYAIELGWPEDGKAMIHSITVADGVRAVKLLGSDQAVQWRQTADGLSLTAPARPPGLDAYVYEIELASGTKP